VAAGVLTTTIDLAEREAQVRRRNAAFLRERLAGSRLGMVQAAPGTDPGWLRLPVRLESGTAEAVEADRTARGLGIYRSYPKPLNELPGMAARISPGNDLFPGAKELVDRLVTLPTHSAVGQPDLERIIVWGRSGF
jgi:dTDP-4-amino-4,6-dideoxygalactose transaminase